MNCRTGITARTIINREPAPPLDIDDLEQGSQQFAVPAHAEDELIETLRGIAQVINDSIRIVSMRVDNERILHYDINVGALSGQAIVEFVDRIHVRVTNNCIRIARDRGGLKKSEITEAAPTDGIVENRPKGKTRRRRSRRNK